jgi:hypothetical protein
MITFFKYQIIPVGILLLSYGTLSCSKNPDNSTNNEYLTGTVKNQSGVPLNGVKVLVDHSIFFNSNISSTTDKNGKYQIKIPIGSWYAFAQHRAEYNGKTYSFYLHPDNTSGFGAEGGVRNFEWKLTGEMPQPLSGNYGGLVTIDHFPGIYIDDSLIDFTFTPAGPLIDGSSGKILHLRSNDGFTIKDIPIGRYNVTASYLGKQLKLRKWNSDEAFIETYQLDFEPQIPAQCDNCAKLEYFIQ